MDQMDQQVSPQMVESVLKDFCPRGYQGTQGNSGVRMEISNGVLTFITQ